MNNSAFRRRAVEVLALACLACSLCHAGSMAYVGTVSGTLDVLDLQTGALTGIGASQIWTGLAYVSGTLYGDDGTDLYTVNPATGGYSLVGLTSTGYSFSGGQFENSLYAIGYPSSGPSGVEIAVDNLGAGGGTVIGTALTYSTCPGNIDGGIVGVGATLYADFDTVNCTTSLPTASNALYSVNTTNGAISEIGLTGIPAGDFYNLFSIGGVLYASVQESSQGQIYTINTSTGAATFDFNTTDTVTSAAVDNAGGTPEPGTTGLALIGLAGCWLRLRRNRAEQSIIVTAHLHSQVGSV